MMHRLENLRSLRRHDDGKTSRRRVGRDWPQLVHSGGRARASVHPCEVGRELHWCVSLCVSLAWVARGGGAGEQEPGRAATLECPKGSHYS